MGSLPDFMPFRDLLLLLIVCLAWGFNFTAGAQGMQHFSPFLLMIVRFLIVLAVLGPFLRIPPPGQWPRLIFVCLCIGALHFTLLFWALGRSGDVSSIAIALQTYIPMAVVLAMVFLGERVGWRSLLATFVAFLGVAVFSFDPLVLQQLDVLAIALASALFQALGSIFMRGIRGMSVFNFQAWTALISLPVMVLGSLLIEQDQLQTLQTAGLIDWSAVAYSALVSSIVGHGLFFFLVQRHPVSAVMPYLLLTPVFAVMFGIVVWGDQPGGRLILGGVMVMVGILIITLRARRKTLAAEALGD
jgi:O-acetylserine/cysteine efflux transporter